jgi:hypothetical protein
MSKTTNKFSPEVCERAVRLVPDNKGRHGSRWQAMKDSHKLKPESFRKRPCHLPGCDRRCTSHDPLPNHSDNHSYFKIRTLGPIAATRPTPGSRARPPRPGKVKTGVPHLIKRALK